MMFLYQNDPVFVWGLSYQLGEVRRDLKALKEEGLISSSVDVLAKTGYQHNFGVAPEETLLSLAKAPMAHALGKNPSPSALIFHHSYAESGSMPWAETDCDLMSRARYFPAALLKEFNLDHLPYFGSFASGCTGFLSLLLAAGGLLQTSGESSVICITGDMKPEGVKYDGEREKILTSDCASGFVVGKKPGGYQLLGVSYYSTTRALIPLVEIVKRTVQMVRDLSQKLNLDVTGANVMVHYPNIFPEAWKMVTHYLKISPERQVLDEMAERAHCLSSDSTITLAKWHRGDESRLHIVVNFGSGLHLGVCILKEEKDNAPAI